MPQKWQFRTIFTAAHYVWVAFGVVFEADFRDVCPMPAADLPVLETRLEACLIELERLYEARPRMSDALGRAGAGQRIDELLDEIAELQHSIDNSPAETLQDAAVKLRRLTVCVDSGRPARLLGSALAAVERAVERA